jgi:hypothetical protein
MFLILQVFIFYFHSYYHFLFVILFLRVVTNDGDVVNVVDLVVHGKHGGVVDVSAQGCTIVDNNFICLIKTQFMFIILLVFFPWARLLLVFLFLQTSLLPMFLLPIFVSLVIL